MITSAPAKILVGISSDSDDSKELLSWAIRVLARPSDTLVALHVLDNNVAEETRKLGGKTREGVKNRESVAKYQTQIRQAKAFVISVMGEFAKICQSKQVNLEAKVGFSSSIAKGLVEEAKGISAEFLLIGGLKNRPNRISHQITKYCFKHTPEGCSVILVGKCRQQQQDSLSSAPQVEAEYQKSIPKSANNNIVDKPICSAEKPVVSETKREKPSPRTVLDACEGESNSIEDYSSSFGDLSTIDSPSLIPEFKGQSYLTKPPSPFKRLSSFLRSSFDLSGRKRNEVISNKGKQQPLLTCFTYEEIATATNNFHQDNIVGRGGYSEVYRGDLDDGRIIAVKRLAKDNTNENKEKGFLTELGILGHVNHPNTANLVGCCIENGLHLIFNLSPHGTLALFEWWNEFPL